MPAINLYVCGRDSEGKYPLRKKRKSGWRSWLILSSFWLHVSKFPLHDGGLSLRGTTPCRRQISRLMTEPSVVLLFPILRWNQTPWRRYLVLWAPFCVSPSRVWANYWITLWQFISLKLHFYVWIWPSDLTVRGQEQIEFTLGGMLVWRPLPQSTIGTVFRSSNELSCFVNNLPKPFSRSFYFAFGRNVTRSTCQFYNCHPAPVSGLTCCCFFFLGIITLMVGGFNSHHRLSRVHRLTPDRTEWDKLHRR